MQANLIQNSFLYGEVSENLYGRTDSPAYNAGAKTFRNFVVKKLGGSTRRPGTIYDFEVKDSSKATRIVPFEYRDERFILEFGEFYIRFHKQDANGFTLVTDDGWTLPFAEGSGSPHPIYNIGNEMAFLFQSTYNAPVTTGMGPIQLTTTGALPTGLATSTDYWLIVTQQQLATPEQKWHPYGPAQHFFVSFATSRANALARTQITLSGSGSGTHTVTLNLAAYEVQTDYTESDLAGLRFAQNDDVLYVTSPNFNLARLNKLDNYLAGIGSDAKWRFDVEQDVAGPWRYTAPTVVGADAKLLSTIVTGSFSGVGSTTFTIQGANGTEYPPGAHMPWDTLRVGDYVMLVDDLNSTSWGVGEVTSIGAHPTYDVTATLRKAFEVGVIGPVESTGYWLQLDWDTTVGFPSTVAVSNNRVVLGGGGHSPHVFQFSSIAPRPVFWPIEFDGTVTGATAFSADPFGDNDAPIRALVAAWDLFAVTNNGLWSLGPNSGVALTSSTVSANRVSEYGGNEVEPVASERLVAYISKTGKRAYGVVFKQNATAQDSYGVNDLTLYADHILDPGVLRMAYQQEPYSTIWAALNDGTLASMTLHSEEGTVGWAGHTIAGTAVTIEDIVSMASFDSSEQNIYMLVNRTVDGNVVRYVEHISSFVRTGDLGDYLYLDCAATYSGAATQTPSGFDHLDGETVHVVSDDVYVGTLAVSSGQIDLGAGETGAEVHVGFTYNSDVETLTPEVGTPFGTVQGSLKRISRSVLRLRQATGGFIGPSASSLDPVEYEEAGLFTGDVEIPIEDSSRRDPTIYVRQDLPYPFDIDAIVTRVDLESRGGP